MDDHCEHGNLDSGYCMCCGLALLRAEKKQLITLLAASESVRRNADARVAELGEMLATVTAENERMARVAKAHEDDWREAYDARLADLATVTRERDEARADAVGWRDELETARSNADEDSRRIAVIHAQLAALRAAVAVTPERIEAGAMALGELLDPGGQWNEWHEQSKDNFRKQATAVIAVTARGEAAGGVETRRDQSARSMALNQLETAERIIRKRDAEVGALISQLAAIRSVLEVTTANVEFVADFFDRWCSGDHEVNGWMDSAGPSAALLRALALRAATPAPSREEA